MKLTQQRIILTGGTSGVGLSLLDQLHARHNTILIVARDPNKWASIAPAYPNATYLAADLGSPDELERLLQTLQRDYADHTVLINNAGIQYNYTLDDTAQVRTQLAEEIQINLIAAMQLCAAALPRFRQQPEAAIVNVTSGLALSPKRSAPAYCAAKAGLRLFTKALRYQLEGSSVRAHEAMLPLVDTPMTAGRGRGKISPEQAAAEIIAGVEAGRSEIYVGKAALFRWLHRIAPTVADRLLKEG